MRSLSEMELKFLSTRYSFHNLLLWLFLYLVAAPFLQEMAYAKVILSIFISSVLFFAVYAINKENPLFRSVILLMALSLLLIWLDVLNVVHFPYLVSNSILIIYLSILVYAFTRHVFSAKKVDSSLICAALSLYLLIGMLWGIVYEVVERLAPGSFAGDLLKNTQSALEMRQHFQYLSFVTLTTLGYGDILPQTPGASALCHTEAIVGQIFLAVLVARLVGIQVSQEFSNGSDAKVREEEKEKKKLVKHLS